jgi:hypothetical protein
MHPEVIPMKFRYVFGIAILIFGFLAIPVNATAERSFSVLDNQVQVRQAHLAWKAAEQESGMQAAIKYIDSLDGADTAKLTALYREFVTTADTIGSLDTHAGLNAAIRRLIQGGVEFRLEATTQMVAGKGSWSDLRAAIRAGLENDKTKFDALELAYWNIRVSLTLENFQTRVDRAQQVLDALKTKGYITAQPQSTLDAIKVKKGELQAALESRDTDRIRILWTEIHDLSRQLAAQVKDLQIKVPGEKKVQFWINVGDRAIERAGQTMNDLDRLGIDTSSLKPVLGAAKDDLQAAQNAFTAGDLVTAEQALRELRSDLKDLAGMYRKLVKDENLFGKTLKEIRSVAGALDSTADQMKEVA